MPLLTSSPVQADAEWQTAHLCEGEHKYKKYVFIDAEKRLFTCACVCVSMRACTRVSMRTCASIKLKELETLELFAIACATTLIVKGSHNNFLFACGTTHQLAGIRPSMLGSCELLLSFLQVLKLYEGGRWNFRTLRLFLQWNTGGAYQDEADLRAVLGEEQA
eukprot:1157178-Pelagomonas_calceolata.AAC.2